MARAWAVVVGAPLVFTGLGCKSPCDEAGLRRAAAAFEGQSAEQDEAGMQALGEACPTLPSALRWSLLSDFTELPADQRLAVYVDRANDSLWNELLLRTCPRAFEPPSREGTPEEQGGSMRRTCELDRYGLLAPDEVVVHRDLGPFMLYEWLLSQRVDEALARAVVRPLLAALASPEERATLCLRGELSCDTTFDAWGLRPPRSTADLRLEVAPAVHVTASAISFAGAPVVTLDAGRPSPGEFVGHVSTALLQRLGTLPDARPGPAVFGSPSEGTRLVVAADAATPSGTLADVAFTASRAGFPMIELVAHGEHGLLGLPLSVPLSWLDVPEGVRRERGLELTFVVHRDTVVAHLPGGSPTSFPGLASCEPPPSGCHDHVAIAAFATRVKQAFPHETVATFRVDGDVPLQAFVSVVDTVRGGEACTLAGAMAGEAVPEPCLFWMAIVDLEPPAVPEGELGSRGGGDRG